MSEERYEDYYAGKNNQYKEQDNLIFKNVMEFCNVKKKSKKKQTEELKSAVMSLYIQNQAILSTLRHITDAMEEQNHV